jgi:cystathionine beta-lyase/cystathionine gamma-synthase
MNMNMVLLYPLSIKHQHLSLNPLSMVHHFLPVKKKVTLYTRMLNPTVEAMENAIAELEGGHKALGCGSGMAAVHTIFGAANSSWRSCCLLFCSLRTNYNFT